MFKVNIKETKTTPGVSIVNFEHVNADWVVTPVFSNFNDKILLAANELFDLKYLYW